MNPVIERMLLKDQEQQKRDRKMVSQVERACKCGTMVKLEDRTPSQKRNNKYVCVNCERERKMKYRKTK